jgi:hypothetical protein
MFHLFVILHCHSYILFSHFFFLKYIYIYFDSSSFFAKAGLLNEDFTSPIFDSFRASTTLGVGLPLGAGVGVGVSCSLSYLNVMVVCVLLLMMMMMMMLLLSLFFFVFRHIFDSVFCLYITLLLCFYVYRCKS